MTSAARITAGTASIQEAGRGPTPTAALHDLVVRPIPFATAKKLLVKHHYLHSLPGGTRLAFGVFLNSRLFGAITFGCGPTNAYRLVEGSNPEDCMVLTRLWLSDEPPQNSESRVISVCLRAIRKYTRIKFLVSYADPSQGHMGTIYQATGWLYTGLSEAMPLFDLGDGVARHSRSLSHAYGSHSTRHFNKHGARLKLLPQAAKHRYVYLLDASARSKLKPAVLPYPKAGRVQGCGTEPYKLIPLEPPTYCKGAAEK